MIRTTLLAAGLAFSIGTASMAQEKKPLKVFILAGQSNMEGHGNVMLTERAVANMKKNGTYDRDKSNYLEYLVEHSENNERYRHL